MMDQVKMFLYGFFARGPRDRQNSFEPKPVEVTSDGALKVSFVNPELPEIRTRGDTGSILLASVLLGATSTTIFTAAANYRDVTLIFVNVDTVSRTYQASHGTLDDTHSVAKGVPLAVGDKDYLFIPGMESGDVLRGLCDSANKVAVQVYGVNVS